MDRVGAGSGVWRLHGMASLAKNGRGSYVGQQQTCNGVGFLPLALMKLPPSLRRLVAPLKSLALIVGDCWLNQQERECSSGPTC